MRRRRALSPKPRAPRARGAGQAPSPRRRREGGAQGKGWMRRTSRVAAWNFVLLAGAVVLVAGAGEAWLRATRPFRTPGHTLRNVPAVGLQLAPHTDVRALPPQAHREHWVASRTNSLGFLDREPPSPELARAGCHVAFVGDSFVEGRQVALADRFHVRLEEMAATRLPHLDVATTAWSVGGTGQVQQLPWWDKWIRLWSPDVVALVFVDNDWGDNIRRGGDGTPLDVRRPDPDFATAHRGAGDQIVLRLPGALPNSRYDPLSAESGGHWAWKRIPPGLRPWSASWLQRKWRYVVWKYKIAPEMSPPHMTDGDRDFTAFALDQWLERTQRAGSRLVVLSTHVMRLSWPPAPEEPFERLAPMAEARDVLLVDQYDYIVRQGGDPRDANWREDSHWNAQGHQWAAEAMLERLERNPGTCGA